jgi:hypothetical protein
VHSEAFERNRLEAGAIAAWRAKVFFFGTVAREFDLHKPAEIINFRQ